MAQQRTGSTGKICKQGNKCSSSIFMFRIWIMLVFDLANFFNFSGGGGMGRLFNPKSFPMLTPTHLPKSLKLIFGHIGQGGVMSIKILLG